MNQECRLKKTDEIKKFLIEETHQTELMSKKQKSFELYWTLAL